jgi:hypothetical protein
MYYVQHAVPIGRPTVADYHQQPQILFLTTYFIVFKYLGGWDKHS